MGKDTKTRITVICVLLMEYKNVLEVNFLNFVKNIQTVALIRI